MLKKKFFKVLFIIFLVFIIQKISIPEANDQQDLPHLRRLHTEANVNFYQKNDPYKALKLYSEGFNIDQNNKSFLNGILKAQKKIFSWSLGSHKREHFEAAIKGYDTLLNSVALDDNLRQQVKNYKKYAEEKRIIGSVDQKIPVLTYHHLLKEEENKNFTNNPAVITVEAFKKQMEVLHKNNYYTATLKELENFIEGKQKLPAKSVVITFDDGYLSNYVYAYPILKKYGFHGAIFMITGKLENRDTGEPFNPDLLNYFSWEEIINSNDVFEFAGHSHNLHRLDFKNQSLLVKGDKKVIIEDLKLNKELLDAEYFAYPYGQYSSETVKFLKDVGYKMAFTVKSGYVKTGDNMYELKRFGIYPDTSLTQFEKIIGIRNR